MEAAADDVVAAVPDPVELDFFDFDQAVDEFCDAYAAAFVADGDKSVGAAPGGWFAGLGLCGDCEGSREGSPDSGEAPGGCLAGLGLCGDGEGSREGPLSTDGPLASAGDGTMSAYARELERMLLEDPDDLDEVVACADGEGLQELSVHDYFGDLLATDDYFNGILDLAAAGAGRDAEEENDDVLAAREDEPPSRKRARHKSKGTPLMPWRGLEVTRRHLSRIQAPAPWPPAAAALRCM